MKSLRYATFLALGYAVLAGVYIYVSGKIAAALARNVQELERLEHIKGAAYVVVTGLMLWGLAWWLFSRLHRSNEERLKGHQALMLVQSKAYAGELAASVAHDFNNLLMVLRAAVDDAEANGAALDATTLKEMNTALDGAQNLTTRLARAARGDRASRRDFLSLRTLVTDTTKLLRKLPRLVDKKLEVVAHSEAYAALDPVLVEQILVNLLFNAADASGKDGVIRIVVRETDNTVSLAVEDNGPGLPDSQMMAVYEPFRSTKSGGLGLGLLSVRASVEAGQANLEVGQSTLGGAKFEVTWPKTQPDSSR